MLLVAFAESVHAASATNLDQLIAAAKKEGTLELLAPSTLGPQGAWGEKKTTEFVRALAKQELVLGTMGELYTRMQAGEILLTATLTDSYITTAKKAGAPIVHADGIEPVVSPAYNAGVLKGSAHPNAGALFAVFLTTPEGQKLWEEYAGQTSAFIPGTTAYKYVQEKKVLYMTPEQAEMIDRLSTEYGKILGFQ